MIIPHTVQACSLESSIGGGFVPASRKQAAVMSRNATRMNRFIDTFPLEGIGNRLGNRRFSLVRTLRFPVFRGTEVFVLLFRERGIQLRHFARRHVNSLGDFLESFVPDP